MSFDFSSLITDRTQADVLSKTGKGSYQAKDLNRVGQAMHALADMFSQMGYAVAISAKTSWTESDWLTPSSVEQYLEPLYVLKSVFAQMQSTPEVPAGLNKMTVVEANNIEKILEDIHFLLTNISKGWYFSGELFSGEV